LDITRFSIEKNRVAGVILVVILAAGVSAYNSMSRNEDPGFIIRTALVQTFFPGASPERIELLVTDKLEKAIQEIPEVDYVASTSKVGVSVIYVNVKEEYKNMRPIWDNLRRKIEGAVGELPDGISGPFVNDEFGDVFGSIIGITGDGFNYRELKEYADEVRDELLLIPDVAKVEIYGDQEERVFVEYDNARLAELGLSPMQLAQLLQSRNIIMPGGDFETLYENIVLEPSGNFRSVEDVGRSIINIPGSREVVRLEDVVDINRGYADPPTTIMRASGFPSLALAVSMREGGNIIDLGAQIRAVIARAESIYPIGIEFDAIMFQADAVETKIDDFVGNLLQAVLVVTIVMLLFLGLRTGLIVASLIPSTMIASFFVMSLFGIGLDQMSLASLIIALGMLVDNAIVMSESIMVRMEHGRSAKDAAIASARELRIPLLTSSLTTSAAFLPIFLAESQTGEYTAPLFKVVTITLLCSWVIALTLIPMLSVVFMKVKHRGKGNEFGGPFYTLYRRWLLTLLRRPKTTLFAVALVFVVAMQGFGLVPNIFFPENDRATMTVELELPEGTPIQRTDSVAAAVEAFMGENLAVSEARAEGIVNWGTFVGEGAPKFLLPYNPEPPSPNYSLILVNASSLAVMNEELIPAIAAFIQSNFPDVNPTVRALPLGAPAWPPVSIRVSGRDTDKLFDIVDEVKARLQSVPGATLVSDNWGPRSKKVLVDIDETRARLAGVSHQDVAISLQTYMSGLETTEYRENDKLIPVVLRAKQRNSGSGGLESINVYAQATGQSVPMNQVAEPELVWQPARIERRDRLRTVTVEALLEPGYTATQVNEAIEPWLREQATDWPFGYSWEFGGEVETSGKANESIAAKLPVAGLIILLLLVAQFNSLRKPAIILVTIPLALIGVVVGLLGARSYFGFMTLLGIISLAGIVINNAIVLLDRIRIEQEEGSKPASRAIIEAAQQRLRPILLTTLTTIGGLFPLWLGGGPMWEPMAISIIFGLAFATILTLGVVPVLYALFYGVKFEPATS